jgi:hypothetical protein
LPRAARFKSTRQPRFKSRSKSLRFGTGILNDICVTVFQAVLFRGGEHGSAGRRCVHLLNDQTPELVARRALGQRSEGSEVR